MRLFSIAAALLLLLAGCASRSEEVLPVARSIKGASYVRGTEIVLRDSAAVLGRPPAQQAKPQSGYTAMALPDLVKRMIDEVTREAGLTSGRPLMLQIELDTLELANTGTAFFGAEDRLAGTVFIRDAGTNEELGQLYIDVGGRNAGLLGLVTRGGAVRERLAAAFARRVAEALGGRKPKS